MKNRFPLKSALAGSVLLLSALTSANAQAPVGATVDASRQIMLPAHIPAKCVADAAARYDVPAVALLAIMKVESGGRIGVVGQNTDGSEDWGPAQVNSRSWGRIMVERFGIPKSELLTNMCQALMVQGYALRSEWDWCRRTGRGDIWCAIGKYHSPTAKYQEIYIRKVWGAYQSILSRGVF
ncbi:lytic transglycosylase domain-containing protein [Cupriavidus necator]|uniref:lytic transglycosylase domain-containing protein n=1 Tax=Cupriavidus necator TaxID=106590 RepID=UPI0012D2F76B|nr:lytic transglycosylase domain-containing protein [Cupriavidus necator]